MESTPGPAPAAEAALLKKLTITLDIPPPGVPEGYAQSQRRFEFVQR